MDTFDVKVTAGNGKSDTATYTVKTPAPPQITDANITSNNAAGIVPGATLTINTITLSYSGDVASPANGNTLGGANFQVAEWHMGGSAGTTGPNSTGPSRDYGKVTADVSATGQTMKVPADATSADYIWVKLVGKTPNVSADPCWVKLAVAKVEKKVTQAIVYVNSTGAQISAPADGASSVTINAASGIALGASESANLTASVNTGKTDRFIFKGWSASANGANPVTTNGTAATNMHLSISAYSATAGTTVFTMPNPILTTDTTIYAVFEVRPQADLTLGVIVVNAAGNGTVTPANGEISISPNAEDLFGGDTYSLSTSTTNAAKYTFLGWSVKNQVSDLMTSGSVNTTNVVKSGTPGFGLIGNLSSTNAGGTAIFTMSEPAVDKTLYAVYQAAPISDLVLGVCIKDLGASGAVSNVKPNEIMLGGGVTGMLNGATTTVHTSTTDTSTYTFKGWATNANGTGTLITGTDGAGLTGLTYSTAGGSGTYTMSGANGSAKNLWAVYEKVATYVLTVTKGTGVASVTVSVNGVEKTAGAGGTYSGIKATDTVVITSAAAANYSTDGFEVTAGSTACTTVNQTDSSFICKISGAVTVNAKAKGMANLQLITTDSGNSKQVGTLATTDVAYAGHLDNIGNAVSGSVSYSLHPNADGTGTQNDFQLTAPTSAGTIAVGGKTPISVTVKNTGLSVGAHTVYLKISETGGSGYSSIVPITFTVTAEPAATTFNGSVTVKVDGSTVAVNAATVKLTGVAAGVATDANGKAAFSNLSMGTNYPVESVAMGGKTYTVSNVAVNSAAADVTVEFFTITAKLDPATDAAALTPSGAQVTIAIDTSDSVVVKTANLAANTVSKIVQKGALVNLTATPANTTGYIFDKWTDSTGDVSTAASYNLQASKAETYVAHLKKSAQVSLIYNGNEAQIADLVSGTVVAVPPTQTGDAGSVFQVSTMKPVLGGYVFKGWSETATGTTAITAPSYTLTANKTLYAIWEKAAITIPDQTPADGVYGSGYNYTVSASRNDSVTGLKYTITGLPGGLGYDSATGRIYGIPYEVGTKTISVTVEPADNTSYRGDAAFKATKSLDITVDKAQPVVTSITPVGSVVSGADLNTVGWQVTVAGPRFIRSTALAANTASTAADWETYTDTIVYPAGKLGPADMSSGVGQATISSTGNKFGTGTSTDVKAEFEPRAMGTSGTAATDFDTSATSMRSLHNKQNGVWKIAEATKPVSHSGNKPILEVSTDGGTTFNANQSWLYAVQTTNAPAHEGYTVNSTGTTGYVTVGAGTAADSVDAKSFKIKNSGSDTTGTLTWAWTSNGTGAYKFTPEANTLSTTAIAAGNDMTVTLAPPANAPAGTYTGTLTVSGGGSTATINVTFVVTNAKTFTAAIKVDKQAMSDANLLENRKFAGGTGLKLVSGADSVTVGNTHWLAGATEGQASGVYTVSGLEAGKTYRLVATGLVGGDYDTGITVSSANTGANVVYYQIATAKDPSDLTLASAQTGAGWYVKDQYATLTTPATGTKGGSTYDFQQWEQGSGANKKTYGGATATVKVEAGNATYTAMYTLRAAGTSTVTYKYNTQSDGGPDMTVVTVTNGQTHTVLPGPSRDGYLFTGWNTDKDGGATGTAYAVGATIAAATVQTNPVLYAQWAAATMQQAWGPASDTGVYGTAYRYTVPTPTTTDGKGVTLSVDASTLPGGLSFDPATGLISGIPYEVGTKSITVTATHNYWNGSDTAHNYPGTNAALTKTYTLNLEIKPATPVVTSITPTGSVISGANLNTVGWTVTVQGPRYTKNPVPAAGTASTADEWETFTDTIVYPVGKLGPADMTRGVGQATISAVGSKFSASSSTNVKAEFEPRAMGTDGTAVTNFDTASQKQSTVWTKAEATLAIPHSGDAPKLQVTDVAGGASGYVDSLTWLYAVNNAAKDPAHQGSYSVGTGNDGYITVNASTKAETVNPKVFTIKNTGTAATGALSYEWLSNGAGDKTFAPAVADISASDKLTLVAGADRTITITPPAGAPAGTYTGTLKITGESGGMTLVNVKFVVADPTGYTVKINTDHWDLNATSADRKNVSGTVVLTQLNDDGTLSSTEVPTSGTDGVYTGSAVFGKKYAVTVNGFRVPNLTITTQNPEATVDLYQVTVVDDPAVGTSVTNASTVDKAYVVKGDDVTVTYSTTPKMGYSFQELQDITNNPAQVRATSGASYTQPITSATAFKVVWRLADTEYTLSFDGNGKTSGDAPGSMTVAAGTKVILPGQNTLEKSGFVFKGWGGSTTTKVGDADFYYSGSEYTVNATKTLYAVWEAAAGGVFLLDKTVTAYYGEGITGESLSYVGTPVGTPSYAITSTLAGDSGLDPLNSAKWDAILAVGSSDAAITGTPKLSGVTNAAGTQTYNEGPFTLDVKMTDATGDHTAQLTVKVEQANTAVDPTDPPKLADGVKLKPGDTFDPATQLDSGKVDAIKHNGTDKLQENIPGTWTLADGEDGKIGGGPTEVIKLVFTPFDEGFKPTTYDLVVNVEAKKIAETVLEVTFPANSPNNEPAYTGAVDSATAKTGSVVAATKNDVSIVKDGKGNDVSWTTGVNSGNKFEAAEDKVLYMVIRPNTADNWVFVTKAAGDGPVKVTLKDKITGDTVEATVISCTETEATVTYKWGKEDVAATNIRDQVVKPVDKAKPNFTAVPIGTPAGSHTTNIQVKWVKDALDNVTAANYDSKTGMTDSDTFEGGQEYVAIVTATVANGYYFDASASGLAALDNANQYAQIRGDLDNYADAKVLKVTKTGDKATEVVIAVKFIAEESKIVGLNSASGPLVYYAKTNTHTDNTATGHDTTYGFTLTKTGFTVNSVNSLGAVSPTTSFALFVDDGTTAGEYDTGDTILVGTTAAGDTHDFVNVYGAAADLSNGTALDGRELWAVLLDASGNPSTGAQNATRVGTLTVKELRADRIAQVGGNVTLTYTSADKAFAVPTAPTATVDFNLGAPMVNTVDSMTYAAYSAASHGSTTYFYEMGDANAPGFVAHNATTGALATGALLSELTVGADVESGKTLYMTYVDKNNNVVRTPVGVFRIGSSLGADFTDENGHDPEYGDKLTAKPEGGTPKPDGTYDYKWEYKDTDGSWKPIPGATDKDFTPGKDDVGKTIHVVITDGNGDSATSREDVVEKRSLNFVVAPQNKNEDKNANNIHTYVTGDFTLTRVLKDLQYDGTFQDAAPVYGGLYGGDTVTLSPATVTGNWNTDATTRPQYASAAVGSEITWPKVLDNTGVGSGVFGGYVLSDAAHYRLAPQDEQTHRGIIQGGGGDIIHVDVSFEEIPANGHAVPDKPMGVTDARETRPGEDTGTSVNTDQNYVASWYQAATAATFNSFDPTAPTAISGVSAVSDTNFSGGKAYTVVVKVKPQPGKFYNLAGTDHSKHTQFFFHFGNNKSVEVVLDATGMTATSQVDEIKTGLKESGGVYYMWYTFTEVAQPEIAHVNVSVPQPVVGGDQSTTITVNQALDTDDTDQKAHVTPGSVTWYKGSTAMSGGTKFEAGETYKVTFTLTADTYDYVNETGDKVDFIVSGVGPLEGADEDTTGNAVIASVKTETTAADTLYTVTVVYKPLVGGVAALTDVIVDASQANKAGDEKTGPAVASGKPYDLVKDGTGNDDATKSFWQYWDGAQWAAASAGTGLDASGNFLAGNDYRVTAQVELTDTDHYKITGDTKFYLAGLECTAGADANLHGGSDKKLTKIDDTTYQLIQEFSISDGDIALVTVTYKEPVATQNADADPTFRLESQVEGAHVNWYTMAALPTSKAGFTGGTVLSAPYVDGTYYMAEATITAKTGYKLSADTMVSINDVQVKPSDTDIGKKLNAEGVETGWAVATYNATTGVITAKYIAKTPSVSRQIIEITANVTKPSKGGTPDTNSSTVSATNENAQNVKSMGLDPESPTITWNTSDLVDGKFGLDTKYTAEFIYKAATNYTFREADGTTPAIKFTINGIEVTGEGNKTGTDGTKVTTAKVSGSSNEYKVTVEFPKTTGLTPITDVTVVYTEPKDGENPAKAKDYSPKAQVTLGDKETGADKDDNKLVNDNALVGSTWHEGSAPNGTVVTGSDTFNNGDYTVSAKFEAKGDTEFTTDTKFIVNGTTYPGTDSHVTIADGGKTATVWHTFPGLDKEIVKVITAVTAPVAGAVPQAKADTTVAANKAGINLLPGALNDEGRANITWKTAAGTTLTSGKTFDYSTAYTAEFDVTTATGYTYLDDTDKVEWIVNSIVDATTGKGVNGVGTLTKDNVTVTTSTTSATTTYHVKVEFPATEDKMDKVLTVSVNTTVPPEDKLRVPDVYIVSTEPYTNPDALDKTDLVWKVKGNDGSWSVVAKDTPFEADKEYMVEGKVILKDPTTTTWNITEDTKFFLGGVAIPKTAATGSLNDTTGGSVSYTTGFSADKTAVNGVYPKDTVFTVSLTFGPISDKTDPTIVKVAANVKQPIANQPIPSGAAQLLLALNKDGVDMSDYVTPGAVTWTEKNASGNFVTPTDSIFKPGGSYQAEFTLTANNSAHKYIAVADPEDYLDLLINGVTHDDRSWLEGSTDNETVGADGSINQIKVDIAPNTTGSEATCYKVTVTFNQISDKVDVLAVLGTAKIPEAKATISTNDIDAVPDQVYEKVSARWLDKDGNPVTETAFKAGNSYTAELTVKIKDENKDNYRFKDTTTGMLNGSNATVVSRDPATGEPTTITLKLDFTVPKEVVKVHVASNRPAAGDQTVVDDTNKSIGKANPAEPGYELNVMGNVGGTDTYGTWYTDANCTTPATEFVEGETYYLKVEVTPNEDYELTTEPGDYFWDNNRQTANSVKKDGDKYTAVFEYTIRKAGEKLPNELAAVVTPPVAGNDVDKVGKPGNDDTQVVGDVKWTDGSGNDVNKFGYNTAYTATVVVKPEDPNNFDFTDPQFKLNGVTPTSKENIGEDGQPNGTYTLTYTFPPTAKKETIDRPVPSGGGGGGGTVELPQVFYKLGEVGVTDDLTAEKVKQNGKPSKVPKVEGLTIKDKDGSEKTYTFIGWSETDPAKTTGTPVLVDPTTFKITKDKTFYAVYEIQGHTAIDHSHYVIGFPNGTFGPGADITRAEVATIIARACLDGFIEGANYGNPGGYTDVERHWAYSAISYCTINSVFTGYTDDTFRPNQPITRQELATVVARLAGLVENQGMPFTDASQVSKWALDGVYTAYANGWINGYKDGSFKPLQNITRAETVKVFNAYLKRGVNKDGLSDMREYVHDGVASNNKENGYDQYMTWPDVPKSHWAYYEIIEAANDHTFYWLEDDNPTPPEHWTSVWIDEVWRYHDNNQDGARPENPSTTTPQY